MIEVELILDEGCADPKVTIRAREKSAMVENIIRAVESASDSGYPQIAANLDDMLTLVAQSDIIRVHTEGRHVILQTKDAQYTVKKSLYALEEELNPSRFIRISQSEIINLYMVKCFDLNTAGTIGVELEGGIKSWVSRSRVKDIKLMLKNSSMRRG